MIQKMSIHRKEKDGCSSFRWSKKFFEEDITLNSTESSISKKASKSNDEIKIKSLVKSELQKSQEENNTSNF